jgi:hypothetical protein
MWQFYFIFCCISAPSEKWSTSCQVANVRTSLIAQYRIFLVAGYIAGVEPPFSTVIEIGRRIGVWMADEVEQIL